MPTQDWPFFQTTAASSPVLHSRPVREHGEPRSSLLRLSLDFGPLLLQQLRVEGFRLLKQNNALCSSTVGQGVCEPPPNRCRRSHYLPHLVSLRQAEQP